MKPFTGIIALAPVAFSSCAALRHYPKTTLDWTIGEYAVHFQAGPTFFQDLPGGYSRERSMSYYRISRKRNPRAEPDVVESAQDSRLYEMDTLHWLEVSVRPSMLIKSFVSATGKTLLITEHLPSDIEEGGAMNYILIQEGMKPQYLDIPIRSFMKSILRDDPEIIGATDTAVTFRYSNGPKETKPFAKLRRKNDLPNFPQ